MNNFKNYVMSNYIYPKEFFKKTNDCQQKFILTVENTPASKAVG